MKKIIGLAMILSLVSVCFAETKLDPCALIARADLVKILGEIKEGPKPKEGLMKEKECEWTNMSGSWLSIGVYSAEKWGLKKGSANNPADVTGLGEEAFTDKRGTDARFMCGKASGCSRFAPAPGAQMPGKWRTSRSPNCRRQGR